MEQDEQSTPWMTLASGAAMCPDAPEMAAQAQGNFQLADTRSRDGWAWHRPRTCSLHYNSRVWHENGRFEDHFRH